MGFPLTVNYPRDQKDRVTPPLPSLTVIPQIRNNGDEKYFRCQRRGYSYPDRLDLDVSVCDPSDPSSFDYVGNADICHLSQSRSKCHFADILVILVARIIFPFFLRQGLLDYLFHFFRPSDLMCIFRSAFRLDVNSPGSFFWKIIRVKGCVPHIDRVPIECRLLTIQHRQFIFKQFSKEEEMFLTVNNGPLLRYVSRLGRQCAFASVLTRLTYDKRNISVFVRNFCNFLRTQWEHCIQFLTQTPESAQYWVQDNSDKVWRKVWQSLDFLFQWRSEDSLMKMLEHTFAYLYETPHTMLDYRTECYRYRNKSIPLDSPLPFGVMTTPIFVQEQKKFFPGAPYWLEAALENDAISTYHPGLFEGILEHKTLYPVILEAIRYTAWPRYGKANSREKAATQVFGPLAMQYISYRPFDVISPFVLTPEMLKMSGMSAENWDIRVKWYNQMAKAFSQPTTRLTPIFIHQTKGEGPENWLAVAFSRGYGNSEHNLTYYLYSSDSEDTDTDEEVERRLGRIKKGIDATEAKFARCELVLQKNESQLQKVDRLVTSGAPIEQIEEALNDQWCKEFAQDSSDEEETSPIASRLRSASQPPFFFSDNHNDLVPDEVLAQDPNAPMEEIDLTCEEDM